MPVIPDTTWYQQLTNPYADQNYMTSARPTGLLAPANFVAGTGDTVVNLSWDAVATATDYEVRIDAGSWVSTSNTLSHQFTGLTNSQSYDFDVRATTATEDGPLSSASATPSAAVLLLSENFESGTLGTTTPFGTTTVAAVTTNPYAGTYCLRGNLATAFVTNDPTTGLPRSGFHTVDSDVGGTSYDGKSQLYIRARIRFDDADNLDSTGAVTTPKMAYFSDLGHGGAETADALWPVIAPGFGVKLIFANQNNLAIMAGRASNVYGTCAGCGFAYDGLWNTFEMLHDRVLNTVQFWCNGVRWLGDSYASDGNIPVHSEFRINALRWFHAGSTGFTNSVNGTGEKGGYQLDNLEVWDGRP